MSSRAWPRWSTRAWCDKSRERTRNRAFGCWRRSGSSREDRLIESGEVSVTRDRHAGYFLLLLDRGDPIVSPLLTKLGWISSNATTTTSRAALRWSQEAGQHDALLRLVGTLGDFWYYRGHLNEGRHWLDQSLQAPVDAGALRLRAWALTESGLLANVCGETDLATTQLTGSPPLVGAQRRRLRLRDRARSTRRRPGQPGPLRRGSGALRGQSDLFSRQ